MIGKTIMHMERRHDEAGMDDGEWLNSSYMNTHEKVIYVGTLCM